MPLLEAIGLGAGLLGSLGKGLFGSDQVGEANMINPTWSQYQTSPFAKQKLGIAQSLYGGRMEGASELERNIFTNQANVNAAVGRNATDSSQALALASLGQGQTNQALNNLQIGEKQNKYNLLNNLNSAYDTMISEGSKEYNSNLQKYMLDVQMKNQLKDAGWSNIFGSIADISGGLIQAGGLFGNKNK